MPRNTKRDSTGRYLADPILDIECLNCGEKIKVPEWNSKQRKFCSLKCSHEYASKTGLRQVRITKRCEYCEKEFTGRPCRLELKKFCSLKCSVEAKKKRIYKECPTCGKEFYATPSDIQDGKGKYCSHECWAKNRTLHGVTEINCKYCGKAFNQYKYAIDKGIGKYCSKKCRDLDQCGPNAINWKGGLSFKRYCPKFNEEFKERVREYFNRVCVLCGKPEQENIKRLSVHHVTGNKRMCCDNEKPAFVPLCESCHHKVHGKMEQYKIYFLELIEQEHNGKCYYTKHEFIRLNQNESLNAQSSISSFQ